MSALEALLERLDVFAYRFPEVGGDGLSKQVYETARKAIPIGQRAGGAGASIFRTREADQTTGNAIGPWYVMVVDDGCRIRDRVRWLGGAGVDLEDDMRMKLI